MKFFLKMFESKYEVDEDDLKSHRFDSVFWVVSASFYQLWHYFIKEVDSPLINIVTSLHTYSAYILNVLTVICVFLAVKSILQYFSVKNELKRDAKNEV
jgi:hypothetical protein